MPEPAHHTNLCDKEEWRPWWVRVWRWLCTWWKRFNLDIWWPVPVLILMVAAALWFRDVELPAYQVASLPSGADPMTIGDATELLLVPFTLAVVAYVFSTYQRRKDQEIARERNEDTELQTYFDHMSELMLTHNLRPPSSGGENGEEHPNATAATTTYDSTASTIARARTLAVLRSIKSPVRKAIIVKFLYESGLINKDKTVVDLRGADLSGAKMLGATLEGINLRVNNLESAKLEWADLENARLEWAVLQGAKLDGTNLRGANLRETIIDENTSFKGARYNNATTPPPGGFPDTAINVDEEDKQDE